MKIQKDKIAVKLELPGAVIRQHVGFGNTAGFSNISVEYFSLSKGVDTRPLFAGLVGDRCQCPHWGFVLSGQLAIAYEDGKKESVQKDDLFYWPPGHNVLVEEDAAIIMFSPQEEHTAVIDHMQEVASEM